MDEDRYLANVPLDAREWRGLLILRHASSDFESLAAMPGLGHVIARRLVELKLAEAGPVEPIGRAGNVGYRMTTLGWKFVDRGRMPRPR